MEDSRPLFFCKRFSYNENALYREVGSNQRLRLVRSTVQATLGSGSTYGILVGQRLGYRAFLIRHFP